MTPSSRRLAGAIAVLAVLLLGLGGLAFLPKAVPVADRAGEVSRPEARRLTVAQEATSGFFDSGRVAPGSGRGLFETDFFKPPPPPPPAPKPVPPTRRDLVVFYRGLAAFPDGTRMAYLSVEGRTLTLAEGEVVVDGWQLTGFDSDQALLAKDAEKVTLPFNRRATLSVPVKP